MFVNKKYVYIFINININVYKCDTCLYVSIYVYMFPIQTLTYVEKKKSITKIYTLLNLDAGEIQLAMFEKYSKSRFL